MSTTMADNAGTLMGYTFITLGIPLLLIAALMVGFRLWWRICTTDRIGKADVCIIAALV